MEFDNQQTNQVSTLTDILNSINLEDIQESKLELVNNNQEKYKLELDNSNQGEEEDQLESYNNEIIKEKIQFFSDDIDRKIGKYLLNELEKKQIYIDELEEAIKFQEKEIYELKNKLEALNKLELLSKLKSNMNTKLSEIETNLSNQGTTGTTGTKLSIEDLECDQDIKNIKTNKVVQVKKSNHQILQTPYKNDKEFTNSADNEFTNTTNNPDLVIKRDNYEKVKSISKEEEEPRYNGVIMLDRPKKETEIKIIMDYESEIGDSSEKMSDIVKQRRRSRKL
jgi:hypothetical protein